MAFLMLFDSDYVQYFDLIGNDVSPVTKLDKSTFTEKTVKLKLCHVMSSFSYLLNLNLSLL